MANDHLRPLVRALSAFEQEQYRQLGKAVAHAVEATARTCEPGQTEEEIAGQLGHRLIHHAVEPTAMSVAADGRGAKYRRSGFGAAAAARTAVVQATGHRAGLYATCARTVSFGPVPDEFRAAHDLAMRQAALFHTLSRPGAGVGAAGRVGRQLLANTPHEFDWRLAPPGYGAGRFPAEELRRAGVEESLAAGQAVVWQPRVGPAAVVDTLIVTDGEPVAVTPPEEWPLRRFNLRGSPPVDVPDAFVRDR
jgi:Xaa-Pro aminopeptidase